MSILISVSGSWKTATDVWVYDAQASVWRKSTSVSVYDATNAVWRTFGAISQGSGGDFILLLSPTNDDFELYTIQ